MGKVRKHFIFYGAVQGVGFRYRAYHAARTFNVTGFVTNLPDGTVEMEAEGQAQDIDSMILYVEKGTFVRIENLKVKDIPLKNGHSFEIR